VKAETSLAMLATLRDITAQAEALIHDGFAAATPPRRLPHLVRYLRAAFHRLEKARSNPSRDGELARRVQAVDEALWQARARYESGPRDDVRAAEVIEARWLIEELRVSLFAQQLGTDGTVSEQRILRILDKRHR
jgi:ATP-dependent helicase HrpA